MVKKQSTVHFTRKNVEAAVKYWEVNPTAGRESLQYDVKIEGKLYPPKAIAELAYKLAGNGPGPFKNSADKKGGIWHATFNQAGFDIYEKGSSKPLSRVAATMKPVERIDISLGELEEQIINSKPTERSALIMIRIGQGKFRSDLLKFWGGKCAVTGMSCTEILRASHIRRWADCLDEHKHLRLEPENGLLLTANLDALFENGLIGFSASGKLIRSKKLSVKNCLELGITNASCLSMVPKTYQAILLEQHRNRHGIEEN